MNMDRKKEENTNEIVGICPSCQEAHLRSDAEVIRSTKEGTLAHGPCPSCKSGMLILELGRDSFVTSIGVLTELQRHEVERIFEKPPINSDDVLAIHEALSTRSIVDNFQSKNK